MKIHTPLLMMFRILFGSPSNAVSTLVALMQSFQKRRMTLPARLVRRRLEHRYGCYIGLGARIAPTVRFEHPVGIVIGKHAIIGGGSTIFQNVTIGSARRGDSDRGQQPAIGDGTTIYAGAKVLGAVTVGRNVIIGANAVVTRDVPDNSIAVGVPAVHRPRRDHHDDEVGRPAS